MIIVQVFPVADEDLLPVDTEVVVDLEDLVDGVDLSTLVVVVGGAMAYTGGAFQSGFTGSVMSDPQHVAGRRYRFITKRTAPFLVNSLVGVTVNVSSLTAAAAADAFSFRVGVVKASMLGTASDVAVVNPGVGGVKWLVYVQDSTVYARKETAGVLGAETAIAPGFLVDAGYNPATGEIVILFEHNGLVFSTAADFIADDPSLLVFNAEQLLSYFSAGFGGDFGQQRNDPYSAPGSRSLGQETTVDILPKPSAFQALEDGNSMTFVAAIPAQDDTTKAWQAIEFFAISPGGIVKIAEVPYVQGQTSYSTVINYGGSAFEFMLHGVAIRYTDTQQSYIVSAAPRLGREDANVAGFGGDISPIQVDEVMSLKVTFEAMQVFNVEAQPHVAGFGGDLSPIQVDDVLALKIVFEVMQIFNVEAQTHVAGFGGDFSGSTVDKEGFGVIVT